MKFHQNSRKDGRRNENPKVAKSKGLRGDKPERPGRVNTVPAWARRVTKKNLREKPCHFTQAEYTREPGREYVKKKNTGDWWKGWRVRLIGEGMGSSYWWPYGLENEKIFFPSKKALNVQENARTWWFAGISWWAKLQRIGVLTMLQQFSLLKLLVTTGLAWHIGCLFFSINPAKKDGFFPCILRGAFFLGAPPKKRVKSWRAEFFVSDFFKRILQTWGWHFTVSGCLFCVCKESKNTQLF